MTPNRTKPPASWPRSSRAFARAARQVPACPVRSGARTSRTRQTRWPPARPVPVELLAAFTQEPRRSMDPLAVFRRLSETAASVSLAAVELRRQEWFDLDADSCRRWEWRLGRPRRPPRPLLNGSPLARSDRELRISHAKAPAPARPGQAECFGQLVPLLGGLAAPPASADRRGFRRPGPRPGLA